MRRRQALIVAALMAFAPWGPAAETKPSIGAVRAYAKEWQEELAAVVAEERYKQSSVEWPRGRQLRSAPRRYAERRLISDVLLVRGGRNRSWLMFRDVLEINGSAVRDRQSRFDALFAHADADLVTSARRIADESARYNLGRLQRNINTPATTLVFLDDTMASSTKWKGPGSVRVDGRPAWEFTFEQKQAPFAIRTPEGRPQPVTGRVVVDAGTGRIRMTELHVRNAGLAGEGRPGMTVTITKLVARFGAVPDIEAWVPLRMDETLDVQGGFDEHVAGEAIYSKHRLFQTSVRIVSPQVP